MDEVTSETASDTRLNILQRRLLALQNHVGMDVQGPLHGLTAHPKRELDDASYMRLMYMKGLCYKEQGNKNTARYCAVRMYVIQECMRNSRKERLRFLDLRGYACSGAMNALIERYTAFLEEIYRGINRCLLMIAGILLLVASLALTLFLRIYFIIAALESITLGMLTYLLQKRRISDTFQKNRLDVVEKCIEQEVLKFDRPIRFS